MIYVIAGTIIALGAAGLWLFRRGKKEAKYEAAEKTIEAARKSASVSNSVDRLSDSDVVKRLHDEWTEK